MVPETAAAQRNGPSGQEKRLIRVENSQEGLDVEVVGSENDLEQHLLVDLNEFLVPLGDVGGTLAGIIVGRIGISRGERIIAVMIAILEDLIRMVMSVHVQKVKNVNRHPERASIHAPLTFLRTLEFTLGRGMG